MVKFIIIFCLITSFSNAQEQTIEIDPWDEIADLVSAAEGPLEDCMQYVAKEGWKEFELNTTPDGRELRVACGKAGISVPPTNKDFLASRTVAFNDALLNIQSRFSEYVGKNIETEVSRALQKGFGLKDQTAMEKDQELKKSVEESKSDDLFKKLFKLANNEIDKRLEGVNREESANQDKIQKEIEDVMQSKVFEKVIKSASETYMTGLQSYKVWEECKAGQKQCEIAILAMRTPEQAALADTLMSKSSSNVRGSPGKKPLPTSFTPKQVMANVGVRVKKDLQGNYHLLSTAISLIETDSDLSDEVAIKEATEEADSNLRLFAGSQVSANSETVLKQIFDEYNNGKQEVDVEKKLKSSTIAFSEKANISGLSNLTSGKTMHPANKMMARYVVRKWSPASQSDALQADLDSGSSSNDSGKTDITNTGPIETGSSLESEEADF